MSAPDPICLICEAMSGAFISVNSVEKTDLFLLSNLTSRERTSKSLSGEAKSW